MRARARARAICTAWDPPAIHDPLVSDEPVPCETCKRPMSAAAARCPHCGALQSRAPAAAATATPARKPLRDVSRDEARALLAVSAAKEGPLTGVASDEQNLLEWIFLPHPRSLGGWRVIEWVLTALTLPATIGGGLLAAFVWRRVQLARSSSGAAGVGRVLAGLGIMLLGALPIGAGGTAWSIAIFAVPGIAVVLRELVRGRVRRKAVDLG